MALSSVRTIPLDSIAPHNRDSSLTRLFEFQAKVALNVEALAPEKLSDAHLVETLADAHLADCYQCGKCTAGCPMAGAMDVMPNQIVRMLQLGHTVEAMQAGAIWACVSCQTCSTRCPKSVNCAGIMDALRELSLERGVASPAQHRVVAFQQAFLENIRRNGRLDEIELIAEFKLRALRSERSLRFLFKDATLAPALQKRRKFHLRGEKVKDRALVRRIFDRCMDGRH